MPEPRLGDAAEPPERAPRDRVCRLLERTIGGFAPTLRGSLALAGLFLGAAILMVIALGLPGVALAAGIAALLYWLNAAQRAPRA